MEPSPLPSGLEVAAVRPGGGRGANAHRRRRISAGILAGALAAVLVGSAQAEVEDGCPRDALRQMMAEAAAYNAVGDVAAIELEVLKLCNRRQALIVSLVEGEARLAELRGAGEAAQVEESESMEALVAGMAPPEKAVVVEPPPPPAPVPAQPPALRWTTVYGSAGEWVAGVTDGVNVWHVREGDLLPSGLEVVAVRLSPPGVSVQWEGAWWALPGPSG